MDKQDGWEIPRKSLGTSRIVVKFGDRQYCCEASRTSLDTSRIVYSFQEDSGYQQDIYEASMKSLDTSASFEVFS